MQQLSPGAIVTRQQYSRNRVSQPLSHSVAWGVDADVLLVGGAWDASGSRASAESGKLRSRKSQNLCDLRDRTVRGKVGAAWLYSQPDTKAQNAKA